MGLRPDRCRVEVTSLVPLDLPPHPRLRQGRGGGEERLLVTPGARTSGRAQRVGAGGSPRWVSLSHGLGLAPPPALRTMPTQGKARICSVFLSHIAGHIMPATGTDRGADEKAGADPGGRTGCRGHFLRSSVSTRNSERAREVIPNGFVILKERFISLRFLACLLPIQGRRTGNGKWCHGRPWSPGPQAEGRGGLGMGTPGPRSLFLS